MRRIIGGRAYDTATAKLLAEASAPLPTNDLRFWHEKIYRTTRGAYFLHGTGGAGTSWAKRNPAGLTPGEDLRPLPLYNAQAWIEKYATEKYESIFGKVEEAGEQGLDGTSLLVARRVAVHVPSNWTPEQRDRARAAVTDTLESDVSRFGGAAVETFTPAVVRNDDGSLTFACGTIMKGGEPREALRLHCTTCTGCAALKSAQDGWAKLALAAGRICEAGGHLPRPDDVDLVAEAIIALDAADGKDRERVARIYAENREDEEPAAPLPAPRTMRGAVLSRKNAKAEAPDLDTRGGPHGMRGRS